MTRPLFEHGAAVRVIRNLRNDGTYPGMKTGDFLIRRGSIGFVRDAVGEVIKVLRDGDDGVAYHVLFDTRVWRVPEAALAEAAA